MAQVAYWILLDGSRVGALSYALPRMSVRSAKYGGHSPMEILELARLWIHPDVQQRAVVDRSGRNHALSVASSSISKSLRVIRRDWHGKYPHLPMIKVVVSWADLERHQGTIYRAANFVEVGLAGGARRPEGDRERPREFHHDYSHKKLAFLFKFRRELTDLEKAQARLAWDGRRPSRRSPRAN